METGLRKKDKTYKYAFKGSVLINSLLENESERFNNRTAAVRFAQNLLDAGHIVSIVGGAVFEDSVRLYRWADESVVREAKKLVETTASYLPRRRLVEMVDLQQSDNKGATADNREMCGASSGGALDRIRAKLETASSGNGVNNNNNNNDYEDGVIETKNLTIFFGGSTSSYLTRHTDETSPEQFNGAGSVAPSSPDADSGHGTMEFGESRARNSCAEQTSDCEMNTPMTCRYDGVEMPALDLENVRLALIQQSNSSDSGGTSQFYDENYSYSDNEKQLLEQVRRMREEHEDLVNSYEDRIAELLQKMNSLNGMLERTREYEERREAPIMTSQPADDTHADKLLNGTHAEVDVPPTTQTVPVCNAQPGEPATGSESRPAAPKPPPLLPAVPKAVQPTKPGIKPRLKMRPLFWNRIILDDIGKGSSRNFWHTVTEPNFDVEEFERLFGKGFDSKVVKSQSLHDAMTSKKQTSKVEATKLLDDKRSRAVAIKLRSMHCEMEDIRYALYRMDFSRIDLDCLYDLYEMRATKEELDKISLHQELQPNVALDHPEQFLYELSQMSHFSERMACLLLRKQFNETLFDINQQLDTMQTTCEEIRTNDSLKTVMELILAFGNYMNGGTQRGQADGFELRILPRLKDVKSMDGSTNLMQYIVRVYCREYDPHAGRSEALFPFMLPAALQQAALVSFAEIDRVLNRLGHQLKTHSKTARLACLDTDSSLVQPFKDQMDDFFDSAEDMIKAQEAKFKVTADQFRDLLAYLAVKDVVEQVTPEQFFNTWAQFVEDFRQFWKLEQKIIAKTMFEKVAQKRKDRLRSARRRTSVSEDGSSKLKNRFAQMRLRSEQVSPQTFKIIRSQSVSGLLEAAATPDVVVSPTETDSLKTNAVRRRRPRSVILDGVTEQPLSLSAQQQQQQKQQPQTTSRSRLTMKIDESPMSATANEKELVEPSPTTSTTPKLSISKLGETMAERMQKRKQSRLKTTATTTDSSPNITTAANADKSDASMQERMQRRRRSRIVGPQTTSANGSVDAGAPAERNSRANEQTTVRSRLPQGGRATGRRAVTVSMDNIHLRGEDSRSHRSSQSSVNSDRTTTAAAAHRRTTSAATPRKQSVPAMTATTSPVKVTRKVTPSAGRPAAATDSTATKASRRLSADNARRASRVGDKVITQRGGTDSAANNAAKKIPRLKTPKENSMPQWRN